MILLCVHYNSLIGEQLTTRDGGVATCSRLILSCLVSSLLLRPGTVCLVHTWGLSHVFCNSPRTAAHASSYRRVICMVLALLKLLASDVLPIEGSRGSLVRRWRLGIVAGVERSACGLDGLERADDDLDLRPDSLESGAVRFLRCKQKEPPKHHCQTSFTYRFLITSVLSDKGRTTPCSL
jgi:hypothetical protein